MPRLKSAARSECEAKPSRFVEDTYEPGAMIRVKTRGLDPLKRMLAREEIDTAQAKAGSMLRDAHELVGVTGMRSIDLSMEKVDGGRRGNGLSDSVLLAARRLRQAEALLGWQSYRLVTCIVCQGCPGTIIAEQSAVGVSRNVVQWQLRSSLEQLAVLWGLAQDPKRVGQRAAITAAMTERASWGHEVAEVVIQYA